MAAITKFPVETLRAISAVLADTSDGLSGSELGRALSDCGISDPFGPSTTKRHRLAEALRQQQEVDRAGNCVVRFIHHVMSPVQYTSNMVAYSRRCADLNTVLGFAGLRLTAEGRLQQVAATRTLSEAAARTARLRNEMLRRGAHAEVLKYCAEELLAEDCFDAVFEAVKGLGDRIRGMSLLGSDGADLIQQVFALGKDGSPMFAFNSLRTETEQSEQKGLVNLMCGVFGAFRNPAAHAPKLRWQVMEADALDLLSTLSLLHRRLDHAVPTRSSGTQALG